MSAYRSRGARWFTTAVALGLSAVCFAQTSSFTAALSGANEVPPNASTATGATAVTINPSNGALFWSTNSSIAQSAVTGHHIHRGAAGINGPVVVNFANAYTGTINIGTTLATEIVGNPGNFYVNLHTATFPGGEIRAQLVLQQPPGQVPVMGLPLLLLLGVSMAGLGAYVFRRPKQA